LFPARAGEQARLRENLKVTVSMAGLGHGAEALDFRTAAALSYSRTRRTLLKGGIALNLGRLEFRFVILPGL
ncbi:MAG: hypothetical protein ACHBMF_08990, partial [Chromatiales bacterium]